MEAAGPEQAAADATDAAAAVNGTEGMTMTEFSLDLSEEQRELRDWVHGFAARRRAPGRGRVGRARGDALAGDPGGGQGRPVRLRVPRQLLADPTGLSAAIASEELFWGDAGIGMAIMGTARRRRDLRLGHARAAVRVGAAVLRRRRRPEGGARSAPPSRRPAPTSGRCAPAPATTRPPTSGSSMDRRRSPPTAASPTCTW